MAIKRNCRPNETFVRTESGMSSISLRLLSGIQRTSSTTHLFLIGKHSGDFCCVLMSWSSWCKVLALRSRGGGMCFTLRKLFIDKSCGLSSTSNCTWSLILETLWTIAAHYLSLVELRNLPDKNERSFFYGFHSQHSIHSEWCYHWIWQIDIHGDRFS